ncbi:MAG: sugar ABC transporter ATP-binding protein [Planctomycetota bacterium]|nr:sugar ABC transporter ATP-binding protein [Planctomycetota bacterium]
MTVRLAVRLVTVRYGANEVLSDVSLNLAAGEVRALLGANGAGKSTLLKVLAGALCPVEGEMSLDGAHFAPHSTRAARRSGVVIVPQEPAIVSGLSVAENLLLGVERSRCGIVRRGEHNAVARSALARLGHGTIDLARRGSDLSLAEQHVVAIARALVEEPRVVVLDEPTSALDAGAAAHVIACVRELARHGVAVVYVTHFLDEVARVADTFTVLEQGRVVRTGHARDTTLDALVECVFGSPSPTLSNRSERDYGDVVLSVTGLSGRDAPRDVDLFVRRGEIVGLFGLGGSGRSALLSTILGADERTSGTVRVQGSAPLASGARAGVRAGIGLLARDRAWNVFRGLSVCDQVTIGKPMTTCLGLFSSPKREREAAHAALASVGSDVDPRRSIDELSGGTQQKAALARLVHQAPSVMLLDEPMRGLDVNSTRELEATLSRLAHAGHAVVVSSSDEEELLRVCDTIAVMRRGRIVEMRATEQWSRADLLRAATCGVDAA